MRGAEVLHGDTGSDPLHPPSHVGQAAVPGGLSLRRTKHPLGPKNQQKNTHTAIKLVCPKKRQSPPTGPPKATEPLCNKSITITGNWSF